MDTTENPVHTSDSATATAVPPVHRVARGVRMDASLWAFVDSIAGTLTDGSASRLIERWVAEKREAL